jgi:hypothetical protein
MLIYCKKYLVTPVWQNSVQGHGKSGFPGWIHKCQENRQFVIPVFQGAMKGMLPTSLKKTNMIPKRILFQ